MGINYEKYHNVARHLVKKLYDVSLIPLPKCYDELSANALAQMMGYLVLNLCAENECFLEDFKYILETSDGTPKSRKDRA